LFVFESSIFFFPLLGRFKRSKPPKRYLKRQFGCLNRIQGKVFHKKGAFLHWDKIEEKEWGHLSASGERLVRKLEIFTYWAVE
jgi:hypothetical protein